MPENREATFEAIGGGDLVRKCNFELGKLLKNIMDPNTDAKAKRTLNVTVTMIPNKNREGAIVKYSVNPKPAPMESEETHFYLSLKANGDVTATEINPKQQPLEFSQTEIKVADHGEGNAVWQCRPAGQNRTTRGGQYIFRGTNGIRFFLRHN